MVTAEAATTADADLTAVSRRRPLATVLAVLSRGNSLLNVGTASMVSTTANEETQGSAFGVTQGAGNLGRTVGPPLMTGIYVLAFRAPFVLGAVLTVAVVVWLIALWGRPAGL